MLATYTDGGCSAGVEVQLEKVLEGTAFTAAPEESKMQAGKGVDGLGSTRLESATPKSSGPCAG